MATQRTSRLQVTLIGVVAVLIGILIGMLLSSRQASTVATEPQPSDEKQDAAPSVSEPPAEMPPEALPKADPAPPLAPEWIAGAGKTMVSIDVAWERSCGVWDDGALQCWGDDSGDAVGHSDGTLLKEVSLGDYHGCGITTEGETRCWGTIEGRPFASPRLRLVALRATGKQQCGLNVEGSVVCWGVDSNVDRVFGRGFVTFDVGLHGAICGIDVEGSMRCDGGVPVALSPPDERFSQVSVGESRACGVTLDGEVLCFGHGTYEHRQESFDAERFMQVGVANDGGCNLREDGELRCWGRLASEGAVPVRSPISAIAVGESHSCAIAATGRPVCWGSNSRGQARPPAR